MNLLHIEGAFALNGVRHADRALLGVKVILEPIITVIELEFSSPKHLISTRPHSDNSAYVVRL